MINNSDLKKLKEVFRFKIPNLSLILSLLMVLGGWVWAYFALRTITDPLVIQFGSLGIERIGYEGDLAKVGIFGAIAVLVNFLIAVQLEDRDKFIGRITSAFTVFLGLLIFVYFAAIISVN